MRLGYHDSGYSPTNLQALLAEYGVSKKECAAMLGVSPNAVYKWAIQDTAPSHRDMPYRQWKKLINILDKKNAS